MDLNEYGAQVTAIMDSHRTSVKETVTTFITRMRSINEQTNAEIARVSNELIGMEQGPTDKKAPAQITNSIFGSKGS